MRATFTTTVAYCSNSGDMTATDMIYTLHSWATINGASARIQIGGTTVNVSQVCTPSCNGSSSSGEATEGSTSASNAGGLTARLTAGVFVGGLIAGIILLAIPVTVVW